MTEDIKKIVPDALFYSTFRNMLNVPLFIWWAGTSGKTIPPGGRFKVDGDPRFSTLFLSRSYSAIDSIKSMMERGRIEFCASPAIILDNLSPDGASVAMIGDSRDVATPVVIPIEPYDASSTDPDARKLPKYKPSVVWDAAKGVVIVDWSHDNYVAAVNESPEYGGVYEATTEGSTENPLDTFVVVVTLPNGRKTKIQNGSDKRLEYIPKTRPGKYSFLIITKGVAGGEVSMDAADAVEVLVPADV
jgi:hypothetical protein